MDFILLMLVALTIGYMVLKIRDAIEQRDSAFRNQAARKYATPKMVETQRGGHEVIDQQQMALPMKRD